MKEMKMTPDISKWTIILSKGMGASISHVWRAEFLKSCVYFWFWIEFWWSAGWTLDFLTQPTEADQFFKIRPSENPGSAFLIVKFLNCYRHCTYRRGFAPRIGTLQNTQGPSEFLTTRLNNSKEKKINPKSKKWLPFSLSIWRYERVLCREKSFL